VHKDVPTTIEREILRLSETLPLIDWNKLTPVFPTFTHSFKDRERKRRIISPYTQSFIPAFDSERWSSTK